ncbi:MAG: phosphoribosylanthranilate isomerase [Planctomycetota bacterium]|nr:phosphoribosylanthranilate isomerase [Planctomycetota bacterium]
MASFEIPFVKVCGVTREEDLVSLEQCSVNSVGINLVSTSPRCIEIDAAKEFCLKAAELDLYSVVVLRNPEDALLKTVAEELRPDAIQLHGSERPERLSDCGDCGVIKALSWSGRDEELKLAEAWCTYMQINAGSREQFRAFLVDAYAPIEGGGTGKQARWDLLQPRPEIFSEFPLILAGGLNPNTVYDGILETCCDGVDTASGVELEPGVKSEILMQQFGLAANHGFARKW